MQKIWPGSVACHRICGDAFVKLGLGSSNHSQNTVPHPGVAGVGFNLHLSMLRLVVRAEAEPRRVLVMSFRRCNLQCTKFVSLFRRVWLSSTSLTFFQKHTFLDLTSHFCKLDCLVRPFAPAWFFHRLHSRKHFNSYFGLTVCPDLWKCILRGWTRGCRFSPFYIARVRSHIEDE